MSQHKVEGASLSPERWAYLKALSPSKPRFIHISCEAYMKDNPLGKLFPRIPFIEKPGHTYCKPKENT